MLDFVGPMHLSSEVVLILFRNRRPNWFLVAATCSTASPRTQGTLVFPCCTNCYPFVQLFCHFVWRAFQPLYIYFCFFFFFFRALFLGGWFKSNTYVIINLEGPHFYTYFFSPSMSSVGGLWLRLHQLCPAPRQGS